MKESVFLCLGLGSFGGESWFSIWGGFVIVGNEGFNWRENGWRRMKRRSGKGIQCFLFLGLRWKKFVMMVQTMPCQPKIQL